MDAACTHEWRTCPVHGRQDGSLPSFRTVLTCIYGGVLTKAGTSWDEQDSAEVQARVLKRLEG